MKDMMANTVISPTPTHSMHVKSGSEGGGAEASSGGESDWTGTGDDWTGTSSDSTFINFIRSQHQSNDMFHSPGMSPCHQLPRTAPSLDEEMVYMEINQQTINQDNQYCSLREATNSSNRTAFSPSSLKLSVLQPVVELTESTMDDDGYCKMVPNASVRTELKQRARELTSSYH